MEKPVTIAREADGAAGRFALDPKFVAAALWILFLSVAARMFFIMHATWIAYGDTVDWHALAWNFWHGHGMNSPGRGNMTLYVYRMPGYPFVLGLWYTLQGWEPFNGMVLNLVAEMITAVCVLLVARKIFGPAVALTALGLWGVQVLWTTTLLSEPLFTALMAALLALIVFDVPRRGVGGALVFGCVEAMAVFVRPAALYLLAVPWLFRKPREWSRRAVLLALVTAVPVAAGIGLWAYRNYQLFHAFVPFSATSAAHNALTYGINHRAYYLEMGPQGYNEVQIEAAIRKDLRKKMAERPGRTAAIILRQMVELFALPSLSYVEEGLIWKGRFAGEGVPPWVYSIYRNLYYQYFPVYVLGFAGLVVMLWRRMALRGLAVVFLGYIVFHGFISFGNIRYAAPLYPILCIFAAFTLVEVARALRAHPSR